MEGGTQGFVAMDELVEGEVEEVDIERVREV